jgi:L-alanine-DL-glutamate epimerase-like enolase superfamily enzyme
MSSALVISAIRGGERMKITDVETIGFKTSTGLRHSRWVGIEWGDEAETTMTITRIVTDEEVEGCMIGGNRSVNESVVRPLLVGENPLDREKIWNWMDQISTNRGSLSERDMGIVDCALWDLLGRAVNLPVHKILGGCRERVKAYASSFDHLGKPEDYAEHAAACKKQGYRAYKVHAYVQWDPHNWEPAPLVPAFPKEDVEVCKAVREAVGDDMILMLDPFGGYSLNQALWVGRELEKLDFYWLEHPMMETRIEAYRRLTQELDIAVLSPEHIPGGIFSRAEWVLQGASDMMRVDYNYGGITGCYKLVNICQAYGIQCEMHGGGWANSQILGATSEATCEYYERGLLHPDRNYETPPPYLKAICDPMDNEGNVILTQKPGLGMEFDWDYIDANRVNVS